MSFDLTLSTPVSPAEALEAVQRNAPYWQESHVPPQLRRLGAFGVGVEVRGKTFVLYIEDMGECPEEAANHLADRLEAALTADAGHAPRRPAI